MDPDFYPAKDCQHGNIPAFLKIVWGIFLPLQKQQQQQQQILTTPDLDSLIVQNNTTHGCFTYNIRRQSSDHR